MRLCTECHWDGWDRIVDILPERCDGIPEHVNDDENYKIVLLEKGTIDITFRGKKRTVKGPALIELSQRDRIDAKARTNIKTYALYFNPTVIREEFTYERIGANLEISELNACFGRWQFRSFDEYEKRRTDNYAVLYEALKSKKSIQIPYYPIIIQP